MSDRPVEPPAPPAAPKVDPETVAIRAALPRPIRLKRELIIALAAFGSASVMAVAWSALQRHAASSPIAQDDATAPASRDHAAAVVGLPATYGDVPKLGPPLPGDLGKPILERQQTELMADHGDQQRAAQAAARERALADIKAARESGVLVHGAAGADGPASSMSANPQTQAPATAEALKSPLDPAGDPNGQQRKADFVAAQDKAGDANPYHLTPAPSPYLLSAGSVIAASLISGLRSDLPGLVTAQVTENIYDSPTGRILLIPQGARLIGSYDSVVAFGQSRALIVWQRIIFPDGTSLKIDNVPATDPAGYAGLADKVDRHGWQLLKGVALSTILGVGPELALSGQSDLVQALRMSTQDNVSRAGDQITQRNLGVQPTLTIRPGARVRLVVHKDLILAPWRN